MRKLHKEIPLYRTTAMCVYKAVNKTIRPAQRWGKHTVPWQIVLSDETSMLGMLSDLELHKVEMEGKVYLYEAQQAGFG